MQKSETILNLFNHYNEAINILGDISEIRCKIISLHKVAKSQKKVSEKRNIENYV